MKVARSALVRGAKILKKILKIFLGLFKLEQRLIGVGPALLILQSEGISFFPMYRGKTPPRQGGAPARGGGTPRGPKMSKIQVYTHFDRPDSFFPLFFGIFGNDFSWEKITVFLDSARARARGARGAGRGARGLEGGRPAPFLGLVHTDARAVRISLGQPRVPRALQQNGFFLS